MILEDVVIILHLWFVDKRQFVDVALYKSKILTEKTVQRNKMSKGILKKSTKVIMDILIKGKIQMHVK